jgi:hypothetical protein
LPAGSLYRKNLARNGRFAVAVAGSSAALINRFTVFASHGPASLLDFVGRSGLPAGDARAGIEGTASDLCRESIGGISFWMAQMRWPSIPRRSRPVYYRVLMNSCWAAKIAAQFWKPATREKLFPVQMGFFLPTVVVRGHVVGNWKRALKKKTTAITVSGFKRLTNCEKQAVRIATGQTSKFIGLPAEILFQFPILANTHLTPA